MRITSDEHAFITALVPLLGTALGWCLSQRTAVTTAREQRRIEGDRRRDDRRAALYQDLVMRTDLTAGEGLKFLARGSEESEPPKSTEDPEWRARLLLFASPEVQDLWGKWIHALNALYLATRAPEEQVGAAFKGVHDGIRQARNALVRQMRRELEGWHAPERRLLARKSRDRQG